MRRSLPTSRHFRSLKKRTRRLPNFSPKLPGHRAVSRPSPRNDSRASEVAQLTVVPPRVRLLSALTPGAIRHDPFAVSKCCRRVTSSLTPSPPSTSPPLPPLHLPFSAPGLRHTQLYDITFPHLPTRTGRTVRRYVVGVRGMSHTPALCLLNNHGKRCTSIGDTALCSWWLALIITVLCCMYSPEILT